MYRVLKPDGICFIQTPFNDAETKEAPSITLPEDRKKHFGQEDHVRIYALADLVSRLKVAVFKIEVKSFEDETYNGLNKETLILATK